MAAKKLKYPIIDSDVQIFQKGKKPKYEMKNQKVRIQWLW